MGGTEIKVAAGGLGAALVVAAALVCCAPRPANVALVCANSSLQHTGLTAVDLPADSIFRDQGEFDGDASAVYRPVDFKPSTITPGAAFVTDKPIHLTQGACVQVPVRMWAPERGSPRAWSDMAHVWELDHAMGNPPTVAGAPSHVADAAGAIAVRAKLLGVVDRRFEASEDDVAKQDPDNPMSHADADAIAAEALPEDVPNLRICLASDIGDDQPYRVTVPAGTIFESWGPATGDERNPGMDAEPLPLEAMHNAVVLSRAVVVSSASPCANGVATAALSDGFGWKLPLTRRAANLQFQAYGIDGRFPPPKNTPIDDAIVAGIINARAIGDIGHPRTIAESDP